MTHNNESGRPTYIGPEVRCWECGRIATRANPESDAIGCDSCFPDWPHREPGHPAGENEGHAVTPVWTARNHGAPRRQARILPSAEEQPR